MISNGSRRCCSSYIGLPAFNFFSPTFDLLPTRHRLLQLLLNHIASIRLSELSKPDSTPSRSLAASSPTTISDNDTETLFPPPHGIRCCHTGGPSCTNQYVHICQGKPWSLVCCWLTVPDFDRSVTVLPRNADLLKLHVDCGIPSRTRMCTSPPYNAICSVMGLDFGRKQSLECKRNCECYDDKAQPYHAPWVPISPWAPIGHVEEEGDKGPPSNGDDSPNKNQTTPRSGSEHVHSKRRA